MLTKAEVEQIRILATMKVKRLYLTPDILRLIHENTIAEPHKDEAYAVVMVTPAFADAVQETMRDLLADLETLRAQTDSGRTGDSI